MSLSSKKQLKNYELKDLSLEENELLNVFRKSFLEPLGCSQNLEQLFSDAIDYSEFPPEVKNDARSTLKGMVDDAYRMTDDFG